MSGGPVPVPAVRLRPFTRADLPGRARWMADPATMAYNAGFGLAHPGYDDATGCLTFGPDEWGAWLRRVSEDVHRFHAAVEAGGVLVGEAGFGADGDRADLHLVVAAAHRGRGFGAVVLDLLLEAAFDRPGVRVAVDTFPAGREPAETLFRRAGFVRTGDVVELARAVFRRSRALARASRV